MFFKIVRDPFTSFFDDDDEHFFPSCRAEQLSDLDSFRVPLRLLALEDGPRFRRNKRAAQEALDRKKALKRKQGTCCHCNCHEEGDKTTEESKEEAVPNEGKQVAVVPPKKSKFEIKLNVDPSYKPGELKVKLGEDNRSLIIEGSHQESRDDENGFAKMSSHMYQRFTLPKDVNVEELKCDLDEKGLMVISAPRKVEAIEEKKTEEPKRVSIAIENGKTGDEEKKENDVVCVEK